MTLLHHTAHILTLFLVLQLFSGHFCEDSWMGYKDGYLQSLTTGDGYFESGKIYCDFDITYAPKSHFYISSYHFFCNSAGTHSSSSISIRIGVYHKPSSSLLYSYQVVRSSCQQDHYYWDIYDSPEFVGGGDNEYFLCVLTPLSSQPSYMRSSKYVTIRERTNVDQESLPVNLDDVSDWGICDNCVSVWHWFVTEEYWYCYGILKDDPNVCSAQGDCVGEDICECFLGYYGGKCNYYDCYNVRKNLTTKVCNGHGTCLGPNNCECAQGEYLQPDCDYECYGVEKSSIDACSGHGDCVDVNSCVCQENFTFVETCAVTKCYEMWSNNSEVCSRKGNCVNFDKCDCFRGWFGEQCQNLTICGGIKWDDPRVCNGHGDCLPKGCICDGYGGFYCTIPKCFGKLANESGVCSGRGDCVGKNKCDCFKEFDGDDCSHYKAHDPWWKLDSVFWTAFSMIIIFCLCCSICFCVCCLICVRKMRKKPPDDVIADDGDYHRLEDQPLDQVQEQQQQQPQQTTNTQNQVSATPVDQLQPQQTQFQQVKEPLLGNYQPQSHEFEDETYELRVQFKNKNEVKTLKNIKRSISNPDLLSRIAAMFNLDYSNLLNMTLKMRGDGRVEKIVPNGFLTLSDVLKRKGENIKKKMKAVFVIRGFENNGDSDDENQDGVDTKVKLVIKEGAFSNDIKDLRVESDISNFDLIKEVSSMFFADFDDKNCVKIVLDGGEEKVISINGTETVSSVTNGGEVRTIRGVFEEYIEVEEDDDDL